MECALPLRTYGQVPFLFVHVPAYKSNVERLWNMVWFSLRLVAGGCTKELPRPDVIIGSSVHLFAALVGQRLARRMNVPFVLEIRDLWPQTLIEMGLSTYHPAVITFGWIEKYLYRNSDKIITLLPNAVEHMTQKGARAEDITWIPNGVDLGLIPVPEPPHQRRVFTVMYAGSHAPSDTLDSVLDAAAILDRKLPDEFRFLLIGNGSIKDRLRQRVKAEGISNVVFEDPVAKREIFSKLQSADAFIIATRKSDLYRYGISPNKLHDYMAAARPTVISGDPHNNPVKDAEAGITVPSEDPAAIADAVAKLAALPVSERWRMGLRGRRYVEEHHDFQKLGDRLEQVLQLALAGSKSAQPSAVLVDHRHTAA